VDDPPADVKAKRDKALTANPADVTGEVIARAREAAGIVVASSFDDRDAFKGFVIGVARATAEAAEGTGPTEAEAITKLEVALAWFDPGLPRGAADS
jgi:hypothetical protein